MTSVPKQKRIAYLVSRFPSTTETFIAREMNEIERRGADIDLYSLVREQDQLVQPEAEARMSGLVAGSDISAAALVRSQWYWLRHRPGALLALWAAAIVGNWRSPRFLLRALVAVPVAAAFARRMVDEGIEHVHAHWATHPALAAYAVNRLTGIPYSVSTHAHDLYVDQSMLAEKLGRATFVATISEYNKRLLAELLPDAAHRCHVVRCGVRRGPTAVAAQQSSQPVGERPFQVLCVAQFKPYKGQRYLIEALGELRDRGIDVHATFAGDGPDLAAARELARTMGVADSTTFLGSVPSSSVHGLLEAADVFVAPSVVQSDGKADGIPVALMEAMSAGVPVIASDLTGIPELVRHETTGLLTDPGDALSLADAIQRVAKDPHLTGGMVEQGRQLVAAEFTIDGNGARLGRLLGLDEQEGCDGSVARLLSLPDSKDAPKETKCNY